jgi:hypothetical protein
MVCCGVLCFGTTTVGFYGIIIYEGIQLKSGDFLISTVEKQLYARPTGD